MPELQIIDNFPAFLDFWPAARHKSLPVQLDDWAAIYMAPWPELLNKQLNDYASQGEEWRIYATEHVFPYLDQRLPDMIEIHRQLPAICGAAYTQAQELLGLDTSIMIVFHVGIGCGAGWVTTYQNKHAILFGLENIAQEGWTKQSTLQGFVAHEIGHVAHFHWRDQAGLAEGDGPIWQLYIEGFAQWVEHLLMGRPSWHMQDEQNKDWLAWCQENRGWLAAQFLHRANGPQAVRPFFGSWFNLQGHKQTGYFLGHEVIKTLASDMTLREIANLHDLTPVVNALESLSE
jgi:hypothetical protein